ncbi:sugar dehydrogenase complex small subunit [Janthinobacterium sp.]|uniref:sugar dehydrogenase complex small subunit n=1 Tax=Janthinobacterium sp. TaxID=1871054 RepID=UPI00293D77B5|nr:sugar dehydrogenase complex small subunit [Janthinobacterium sp.]
MNSPHRAGPVSGRRRSLLAIAGVAVCGGLPLWLGAAAQTPAAAPDAAAFLDLSAFLIPHARLEPRIAQRLYLALLARDAAFAAQLRALAGAIKARGSADVEALALAVRDDAPLSATLRRVISAWYLGAVGPDSGGSVVAFDLALMHEQVRDVVAVPSYCSKAPGFWAAPPPRA